MQQTSVGFTIFNLISIYITNPYLYKTFKTSEVGGAISRVHQKTKWLKLSVKFQLTPKSSC